MVHPYSLTEASQDQYLALMMQKSINTGRPVNAVQQNRVKEK
ncbi:hypothetical protein JOD18_001887 [Gracilibacillus alcaliphilus]|nr:hypothetical protein [Gracilibacillus alcaliphilus]